MSPPPPPPTSRDAAGAVATGARRGAAPVQRDPRPSSRGSSPACSGPYRAVRAAGGVLLKLILDVRVSGVEHLPASGPVIVAGNHRGVVDGPVVALFVPRQVAFLAKAELFVGPAAPVLLALGQIPVHRGRPDRAALRRALEVLRAGGVLGLFPEGTRGTGVLDQVQHGIAYLALRSPGCCIVPVACLGSERALPVGSWRPRLRTRVDVVFGPPITVRSDGDIRSRRVVAAAAEEIRVQLADHVRRAERELRSAQHAAERVGRG